MAVVDYLSAVFRYIAEVYAVESNVAVVPDIPADLAVSRNGLAV